MKKMNIVLKLLVIVAVLTTLEAKDLMHHTESGIEVRLNGLYSSGRFVQEIDDNIQQYHHTSDLTTKGFSVILGYAREYRKRDQSSFIYIGYERQKWNDAYKSAYDAFTIGVEGGMGNAKMKFIYGGEFAFGALDTGKDDLGYLATFTGEPYVGLRLLAGSGVTFNLRFGARIYAIEEAQYDNVSSSNSAYSVNTQVGLGYQFF